MHICMYVNGRVGVGVYSFFCSLFFLVMYYHSFGIRSFCFSLFRVRWCFVVLFPCLVLFSHLFIFICLSIVHPPGSLLWVWVGVYSVLVFVLCSLLLLIASPSVSVLFVVLHVFFNCCCVVPSFLSYFSHHFVCSCLSSFHPPGVFLGDNNKYKIHKQIQIKWKENTTRQNRCENSKETNHEETQEEQIQKEL